MRQSRLFLNTLRETPAEADVVSHRLMLRAGLIRQLSAGVYTFLPLGYRALAKVEAIVRQEMDRAGAQEIFMPAMQPAELWQQSGRWDDYGPELVRFSDRHERTMALGPTHEEVITSLVQNEVRSWRQLPFTLYQIQTKFRDERRPRAGLLRGREFRMKDAYSFDVDEAGLDRSYQAMYDAYCRIFDRLGVEYRAVEADSGAIGGEGGNHEFMVISAAGEDTIAGCSKCSYAANIEKAVGQALPVADGTNTPASETVPTPHARTIEQLVALLGVDAGQIVKVLVYVADGKPVAACLRGDHEVNEVKLKKVLGARTLEMASAEEVLRYTGKPVGFVGPDCGLPVVFDRDILSIADGVVASKTPDAHDVHVVPNRDFTVAETADIRLVRAGDACVDCGAPLVFMGGIEVGHVFKLGTKYTEAFNTRYADESGAERLIIMGCYGIGTSRIIPAVIEQLHDEDGIIWPIAIAPYHVHVVPVNGRDEEQASVADSLYHRFLAAGVDALIDDRDERPGVKFKDADLIGLPVRITVGNKVKEGNVELKIRRTGEVQVLPIEEAFRTVLGLVK